MTPLSTRQWDHLSEDALWSLATDWRLAPEVREEAMWRWLFPEEYGYRWATLRVQGLRTQFLGTKQNQGMTPLAMVPTAG